MWHYYTLKVEVKYLHNRIDYAYIRIGVTSHTIGNMPQTERIRLVFWSSFLIAPAMHDLNLFCRSVCHLAYQLVKAALTQGIHTSRMGLKTQNIRLSAVCKN